MFSSRETSEMIKLVTGGAYQSVSVTVSFCLVNEEMQQYAVENCCSDKTSRAYFQ